MDDRLALLVGRAILAFGEFDQEVYSTITVLRLCQDTVEEKTDRNVPKTLERRWQLLRQLLTKAIRGDEKLLSKFDKFRNSMKEPVRQRAHLAHGEIREIDGMLSVSDQREGLKFSETITKLLDQQPWEKIEELYERHYNIRYSPDDLIALEKTLSEAKETLRELWMEAFRLRVGLGIAQGAPASKSGPSPRP